MTTRKWFRVMRAADWERDSEALLRVRTIIAEPPSEPLFLAMMFEDRPCSYIWWRNYNHARDWYSKEAQLAALRRLMATILQDYQ